MEKIIKQTFNVDAETKNRTVLAVKLFSQDVETVQFLTEFTQNGELIDLSDGYSVKTLFIFRESGRKVLVNSEIKEKQAVIVFDNRLITEWDVIDAYVYLYKGEQSVDVNSFSFKVDISKIDSVVSDVKTYYIEDIEDVKKEYTKLLNDYLDSLPTADELKGDAGTIEISSIQMVGGR